ncbi:xanthine dehydrogenase family protein molybdopterin-binding subunit [Sabulicella rubraurantiaca]|uniref:xanthine dehydrogenase family protein molybdopterin-binding subunit n=1 Tax=Sabulicella rubraurantiaca TaxID=2811429 RepID=UPI001A9764C7|nr:xanthine dehydrogenase family protein molybdopterin-binding subunit [Sabulicella rubraurantiaca]
MNWVGRRLPRTEDPPLLRGEGRYVPDIALGARAVRFLRSPVASGRIVSLRAPAGLPPGALFVTAADMPEARGIRPALRRFEYRAVEQPILPRERVHFMGQPIALIAAESAELAEDLLEQVELEIEAEDPVVGLEAALAPGAPAVHALAPNNVIVEGAIRPDGFADAMAGAVHVVEFAFRSRRQNATPLEGRGGVAEYDRATGRLRLAASCQMPHMLRSGICEVLGLPEADLQVVAPDVGGGFGQKMSLFPEYPALVWLARRYRGRFAWIEDRYENLIASAHSRDQKHILRAGFNAQGQMVALEADILADIGAFSCYPTTCAVEPLMALAEYPGPYKIPSYSVRARGVLTHSCPAAPYRGVSRPVITFGIERLMDRAAAAIGLDPVEIRRRNLHDVFPAKSPTGFTLDEGSYIEALDEAARHLDIPAFREAQAEARRGGRLLGLGLAVFNERTGYGTPAFAARSMEIVPGYEVVDIAMTPTGEVEARIGASPHGQGLRTTLAQIIADRLGIDPLAVRIIHGDTDRTPYGWGTFASRSLVVGGGACQIAADRLAAKLRRGAARLLQCGEEEVVLRDGLAVTGAGASIPLREVARIVHQRSELLADEVGFNLAESGSYDPPGTFSNACHGCIVEVERETGAVRILRYLVVEDAGRIINPMIADGQVRGGVAQGIANALLEEIHYAPDGNCLSATLADYIPPTCAEIPEIEIHHLETISSATLTGAKGLGEGGTIGAPAALCNAISDALAPFGVDIAEFPATPPRILALIRGRRAVWEAA